MPKVQASIDIVANPEDIWELMCSPARYPAFADPADRMIEIGDGVVKQGYTYKEHGGIRPFKSDSTWTVTTFEPTTHQIHVGDDGQMTIHLDVRVEPTASGSRLTQTIKLKPRWYMAPVSAVMWPLMMRKRAQETMDKTVANVKRILEEGTT